ncbi:tetratricopeptide repeat protein [Streptomyces sp. NPDC021020]|uniref:tetratricopeptide repeat protein n=1 Tax=Streptomyces sp. NPDC021020 TaxID=3365109 RepID=UPI0037947349
MTVLLDLENHDPEEYEGKTVVIDGCPYEIAEPVGSGADKFVHKLRNRRSGLCLSVLAIYRDPEGAQDMLRNEIAAKSVDALLGFERVPNIRQVSLAGAPAAHLQDYVGPFEADPSPSLLTAQQLLHDERWEEGAAALATVLDENPHHTVALNNLAFALARLGGAERAVELMAVALEIEPNCLPYIRSYIQYADAAGRLAEILDGFSALREKYPYDHSCDQLAAEVPGRAAALNNAALDLSRSGRAVEALETMTRSAEAYRRLADGDPEGYDVELAEALVNLGNCHRFAGDVEAATGALVEAMVIAQRHEQGELFGIAADSLQRAWAEDPPGVAAEFERLTGSPIPDWLTRQADGAGGAASD